MKVMEKKRLADAGGIRDLAHWALLISILREHMKPGIQDRGLFLFRQ